MPNSVYDRIDAIVIQFDANKNATEIVIKEGIASSAPIAPNVVRTESLYELHIFHVQRKAGATVIDVDDLVDLRNNSDYCGIMFDPISSIDQTLTKSGYAADAAETGKQIKRATNALNRLHNSDFTHFVAHAGIGGAHGTQAYAGDRWILDSGTVTGEANENGDGYKNITLNGTIRQIMENPPTIGTVFIKMVSGTASVVYEDGAVTINSNGGVIKNVRLFEGEYTAATSPPYVHKGYGVELAECLRYYCRSNSSFNRTAFVFRQAASAWMMGNVEFPVPMRITPSITIYSTAGESGSVREYGNTTAISVGVHYQGNNGFNVNGRGNLVSGTWYEFHYEASADL